LRKRQFKSRHTLVPEILPIGWRLKAVLMTPLCNHYLSGKGGTSPESEACPLIHFGSKLHTAAKAETTGCWIAFHRAFDSKPRGRLGSAA
jgi:hypothetical protein